MKIPHRLALPDKKSRRPRLNSGEFYHNREDKRDRRRDKQLKKKNEALKRSEEKNRKSNRENCK